jgi:hypothetical protein
LDFSRSRGVGAAGASDTVRTCGDSTPAAGLIRTCRARADHKYTSDILDRETVRQPLHGVTPPSGISRDLSRPRRPSLARRGASPGKNQSMKRITITFDNGPTPGVTERVLDVLARRDIRAPFFVIGQQLRDQRALEIMHEAQAAGHWIGNHTLTHAVGLGERATAEFAQAGAAAEMASAQFDGTVIEALRQTDTALSAYAREIDRDRDLDRARDDAAKATDQANRLFRFGRAGFIDVLTAQSSLASAEAALAASQAMLIDRQIDTFLALGGGWES